MRHGKISEEVDQDHDLERLQIDARRKLERRNALKIRELQDGAKTNERDRGRQIGPVSRQQNAGNNNHQRIEEVEEGIDAAGHIHYGGGEGQIGEDLNHCLELVFPPQRVQDDEENRRRVPDQNNRDEKAGGDVVRRQVDDQEFNGKQERNDDDTNFYKPCQPCPLIESNGAHSCRFNERAWLAWLVK